MLPLEREVTSKIAREIRVGKFDAERGVTNMDPVNHASSGKTPLFVPERELPFLHAYQQVNFGEQAADKLAAMELDFPVCLDGPNLWIYKKWAYMRFGPKAINSHSADVLNQVWTLAHTGEYTHARVVLEALLLAPDADIEVISEELNIAKDVVEAYEVLQFNVIGRRQDRLFLRNVVYPDTRMAEAEPGYTERAGVETKIKRAAYNTDFKTALFLCGFRSKRAMQQTVEEATGRFQQSLLQTGALLASSGMLMFDRTHTTMSSARSLIQASKLSGETYNSESGLVSLSQSVRGQLDKVSSLEIDIANEEASIEDGG